MSSKTIDFFVGEKEIFMESITDIVIFFEKLKPEWLLSFPFNIILIVAVGAIGAFTIFLILDSAMEEYRAIGGAYFLIILYIVFVVYIISTSFKSNYYFIQIFLIGVVVISSAFMQFVLFDDSKSFLPSRVIIPVFISFIFIIGAIAHSILSLIDENNYTTIYQELEMIGKIILISIIANLKSYFSPIFIGIGTIMSIYYIMNYNQNIETNVLIVAINWLFSGFSLWVKNTYIILMTIYLLLTLFLDA